MTGKRTLWTPEREARLRELYADPRMPCRLVAEMMGIPADEVSKHAMKLGLPKRRYRGRAALYEYQRRTGRRIEGAGGPRSADLWRAMRPDQPWCDHCGLGSYPPSVLDEPTGRVFCTSCTLERIGRGPRIPEPPRAGQPGTPVDRQILRRKAEAAREARKRRRRRRR